MKKQSVLWVVEVKRVDTLRFFEAFDTRGDARRYAKWCRQEFLDEVRIVKYVRAE